MFRLLKLFLSIAAFGMLAVPVAAQDASDPPAAETEEQAADGGESGTGAPQFYVGAVHGDWALRCLPNENGADPCHMYQLLRNNEGNPVSEISIFNLQRGEIVAGAEIATPLDTLLTENLTISVDGALPRRYPFRFCNRAGCYAQIGLSDADLEVYRKGRNAVMSIVPLAAPDRKVELTISLSGFTAAFAAMVEQNKTE